jgi:2-C-methyl-D-erythritol 2,4-cyclodiphosphate synthase
MAVGFGYDIHRLVPGRRLVLGGVEIPHAKGLLGHSDADVLLHAVADALLGAAGLGDLGRLFPDTDPAHKDVSSEVLLDRVMERLRPAWSVVNVDVTVVAEEPKLAPHHDAIRKRVAARVGTDRVSIKAKTNEGLGPVGAREAIACYAVAELKEKA